MQPNALPPFTRWPTYAVISSTRSTRHSSKWIECSLRATLGHFGKRYEPYSDEPIQTESIVEAGHASFTHRSNTFGRPEQRTERLNIPLRPRLKAHSTKNNAVARESGSPRTMKLYLVERAHHPDTKSLIVRGESAQYATYATQCTHPRDAHAIRHQQLESE